MKTFVTFFTLLFLTTTTNAQLISRFTWESNPAGTAIYGANALSISSYATVSTGGTHGTKGLNPGNGSYDINLVLDGSYFNVPAIDISVDFRREESQATFFYRGNYLSFGMNGGSLAASFQIVNGASFSTINSGNIFAVPDDHSFHTYRFSYDNNTGVAKIYADAVLVYTYTGTAGTPLYYTGAGNVTIGKDMDATGRNVAILDNLVIQKYATALLPLKLLSFAATTRDNNAAIEWHTTEELNIASFVAERSADGSNFSAIKTIAATNGYSTTNNYGFIDSLPFSPGFLLPS